MNKTYKFTHTFYAATLEVVDVNLKAAREKMSHIFGLENRCWRCETPDRTVEFVYQKDYNDSSWRTVEVIKESDTYIEGIENGDFKSFLKNRIVGGKIIEVTPK